MSDTTDNLFEPPPSAEVEVIALEDLLEEFHTGTEVPYFMDLDAYGKAKFWDLRMRLIAEEFKELLNELLDARNGEHDMLKILKEAADLVYVTVGTIQLLGYPFTPAFCEVHESNMSKIPEDGKVVRRADGKILKPPTYREADLTFLLPDEEDENESEGATA